MKIIKIETNIKRKLFLHNTENISLLNKLFPDKLLLHTEGCTGYSNFKPSDELFNAEMYAHEIIGDLNSGCNGFIDWNIVLDYNQRSKSCKKLL